MIIKSNAEVIKKFVKQIASQLRVSKFKMLERYDFDALAQLGLIDIEEINDARASKAYFYPVSCELDMKDLVSTTGASIRRFEALGGALTQKEDETQSNLILALVGANPGRTFLMSWTQLLFREEEEGLLITRTIDNKVYQITPLPHYINLLFPEADKEV